MRLGLNNYLLSKFVKLIVWLYRYVAALLVLRHLSITQLNIFVCQIRILHLTHPEWLLIPTDAPTAKPAPLSEHFIPIKGSSRCPWAPVKILGVSLTSSLILTASDLSAKPDYSTFQVSSYSSHFSSPPLLPPWPSHHHLSYRLFQEPSNFPSCNLLPKECPIRPCF